ncbi:DUF3237 domain-containing protein [Aspergillus novofumigatus IBT 16806]|uniref:Uncharacterized protein n=1 Tax=Aspergillus novofumigatus (strain IBT 16806) TaxID=1392255 RepID=A0A2I1BV00_ASPN1|nr:uncharacterized protein P174DRAFT_445819 [Aspergillus novofumigatus IBT 16806]PKX89223.1 hypothetical protein P174DRAFT_445819 [Aspergillus novofumigatus IBT 16806]
MATPTPPRLNHVFHLRCHIGKDTINAGQYCSGPHRRITTLEGGFLRGIPGTRGDGLDVTLVAGGSDWILFDESTNTAHLDVRTQGRTKDGQCVYIHYSGYSKIDEAAQQFRSWSPDAKTTEFGQHHWWSAPNIEVSDHNFKWVATTLFIGRGRWFREGDIQAVEYEIFEVAH